MSRRLNSHTAPWNPTAGFGAAGASGNTGTAGFGKAPLRIGSWLVVSVATSTRGTQR